MIEFIETIYPDGRTNYRLRADGLPPGMYYYINLTAAGKCEGKSRSRGNGSVRYYSHRDIDEAMAHATAWAKRKLAEKRREQAEPRLPVLERELVRLFGR